MATTKTFENCMDCPHHLVIRDDDPDDWFCDDDKAITCLKTPNPEQKPDSKYLSERSEHRVVMPAIRPYRLRTEGASPSWCPLKETVSEKA